jgi:Skp family chaperone for outer membrane proteins
MMQTRKYTLWIGSVILGASLLAACGDDKKDKEDKDTTPEVDVRKTGELKIAYYDQDSLFLHYEYYLEQDSILTAKGVAFQNELERQSQALQNFIARKDGEMQKGLLSENDIMKVQQDIQRMEQQIMEYQQTKGGAIEKETADQLKVIGNRVAEFGKEYSEKHGLDILMIKASGGQFNYIHPSMDVTKEFTDFLNQKDKALSGDSK